MHLCTSARGLCFELRRLYCIIIFTTSFALASMVPPIALCSSMNHTNHLNHPWSAADNRASKWHQTRAHVKILHECINTVEQRTTHSIKVYRTAVRRRRRRTINQYNVCHGVHIDCTKVSQPVGAERRARARMWRADFQTGTSLSLAAGHQSKRVNRPVIFEDTLQNVHLWWQAIILSRSTVKYVYFDHYVSSLLIHFIAHLKC